jgi:excisionase family DNA binding protein
MSFYQRNVDSSVSRLSAKDLEEIGAMMDASVAQVLEIIASLEPSNRPEYLTTQEVAKITKFKKATLEALRAKRQGPPFYRQGYNIRYREDEVREWMERDREAGR